MEEEYKVKVRNLQIQLNTAEEEMQNNNAAAEILTKLINRGAVEQLPDGSVKIPDRPNVIGNEHEINQ